mmetsp:Transcript_11112/g.5640  ORF Transcript_11112/g.5640 Transcript_11112/m.5640 type:complete len:89 (+) Transcript_11112:32-298(+)
MMGPSLVESIESDLRLATKEAGRKHSGSLKESVEKSLLALRAIKDLKGKEAKKHFPLDTVLHSIYLTSDFKNARVLAAGLSALQRLLI